MTEAKRMTAEDRAHYGEVVAAYKANEEARERVRATTGRGAPEWPALVDEERCLAEELADMSADVLAHIEAVEAENKALRDELEAIKAGRHAKMLADFEAFEARVEKEVRDMFKQGVALAERLGR